MPRFTTSTVSAGEHVPQRVAEHARERAVVREREARRGRLAEHEDAQRVGRLACQEDVVGRRRRARVAREPAAGDACARHEPAPLQVRRAVEERAVAAVAARAERELQQHEERDRDEERDREEDRVLATRRGPACSRHQKMA
jgi:hypothetical protein